MDTDDEDVDAYLDSLEAEVSCHASSSSKPRVKPKEVKEVPSVCFHIVKSVLETQVLQMTLPRGEMTPQDLAAIWTEWGVPHADRIKFKELNSTQWLPRADVLPLAPKVVVLECKAGSVLMALEGACRKRHVEMQTVRKGEVFSWPTWNADQVLEEHHRKTSEEKLRRWREEGLQGPCPSPPEVEPAPSVPLIDPYAPSTAYPEAPPPVASPSPPPAPAPVPVTKPHQEARQVRQVPQTPVAPKAAPKQAPQVPKVAPETESWSSKQQRLKKEQREARLAENLRRRAARGGQEPEETKQERPLKGHSEDAKMHSAENLQDPQSYGGSLGSKEPATKASGSSHSKPRGAVDEPEIGEDEIDLQGVPLRVLRSKRPVSGSGLLSWGAKPPA